jgi:AcrR family transcriptional regulator
MINMKKRPPATRHRAGGKRGPEATRQALLRAGAELFAERGFDGVSTSEVAGRAGVNKALISYHFGGKRGLYVAILESTFASLAERLRAVEAGSSSAHDTLRSFLETFARFTRERPGFPTLFMREVLAAGIDEAVLPHLLEIIGFSRRLAERGAREGVFRRVDPLLFHLTLVGSLIFFFATEPARRRAAAQARVGLVLPDSNAFLHYLEELTLRGLAHENPKGRRRKGAHA